jgi:hypothetical protein
MIAIKPARYGDQTGEEFDFKICMLSRFAGCLEVFRSRDEVRCERYCNDPHVSKQNVIRVIRKS